jgi:hypothetical protein
MLLLRLVACYFRVGVLLSKRQHKIGRCLFLRKDEQSDSAATFSHCGFPKGIRPFGSFLGDFLSSDKKSHQKTKPLSARRTSRSMSDRRAKQLKI